MVRKLSVIAAAIAIVSSSVLPAGAASHTVEIPGRFFQPSRLVVRVGDTVRWTNMDNTRHSVSANSSAQAQGESFDSGANCPGGLPLLRNCIEPGESFSHTFARVGTFTYRCRIHGDDTSFAACRMCGQVLVRERPSEPTIAPTTAGPTSSDTPTTSTSPSVTASGTPTATGSSPIASGRPPGDSGSLPVIPIAAGAVLLLGASAFFVYRSMLKS